MKVSHRGVVPLVIPAVALWAAVCGSVAPASQPAGSAKPAAAESPPAQAGDLDTIKRRILDPLLEPLDAGQVRNLIKTLGPDGRWPEIDYRDTSRSSWKTSRHLSNLLVLSRACKSERSTLHGDPELNKAVFAALDYWLAHDFQNSNWWWNQIGVPRSLASTLLLLEDELSDARRAKGLEILGRAKIGMTGQNLVWVTEITAMRGLLEHNAGLVAKAYRRIAEEIRLTTREGIQPDFSFHQHGAVLYSHGYGAGFVLDGSRIATQVAGTQLAFPAEKIEILTRLILDGHQWFARGSACDYGASGRQISRKSQTARYLGDVARNMLRLPTGRKEEFRALAARAVDQPAPPLCGNRHFWRSDTMTHHREGFYASARMYSSRIYNTDVPCNSEGLTSHHVADGCNLIFRTGKEYHDVFPVWDWQKIPGTTVEQTDELEGELRRKGARDFVGGVSDGTYGLAAMDFARDKLTARKAWFFFDREFVCLGSGITCKSDHPVATTVNQCFLEGDVTVCCGGKTGKRSRGDHALEGPAWIYHDGVAYVFPQPARLHLHNAAQTGSWWTLNHRYSKSELSHDVFTLWIDHGKGPRDSTYAYIVAPGMPLADVGAYTAEPDAGVLRNDPQLQAVWHEKLKIAAVAFYGPGSLAAPNGLSIRVAEPCLLLVRELPGRLMLSAANPNSEALTLHVTLNRRLEGDGAEPATDKASTQVTFQLPDGMSAGQSATRSLRQR